MPAAEREPWEEHFTRKQVMRGLYLSVLASSLGFMFFKIAMESIFTGFVVAIDASYSQIGLLRGALPLAMVTQLFAAYLVERTGRRREVYTFSLMVSRFLWLAVVMVPFLVESVQARVAIIFGLLLVSNILMHNGRNAWMSWMGDLIPSDIRGRFLGTRMMICNLFAVIAAYIAGDYVDRYRDLHSYVTVYSIAVALGLLNVILFNLVTPHPPAKTSPGRIPLARLVKQVLSNRHFRQLIKVFLLWHGAAALLNPLVGPYILRELGSDLKFLVVINALYTITFIVFSQIWGQLIPRIGTRSMLSLSLLVAGLAPVAYLFCAPGRYYPAAIAWILGGVGWPGLFLAYQHLSMELSPHQSRQMYMAVLAAGVGIVSALLYWLGGTVADLTKGYHLLIWEWKVDNFQLIFLVAAGLRLATLIPVHRLPDVEEARVPVLAIFGALNPVRAIASLYTFLARRDNRNHPTRSISTTKHTKSSPDEGTDA